MKVGAQCEPIALTKAALSVCGAMESTRESCSTAGTSGHGPQGKCTVKSYGSIERR